MDEEETFSKRITRGIHLHAIESIQNPSFSLGFTQDFEAIAYSIAKSKKKKENYKKDLLVKWAKKRVEKMIMLQWTRRK